MSSKKDFEIYFIVKSSDLAWLDGNAVGWDMGDSWVWGFTWSMVMPRIEMGKK